jgi:hypothetical protein
MQISFMRKKRSIINRSFPLSRGILPKKFHNARGNGKEISEFCAEGEISARQRAVVLPMIRPTTKKIRVTIRPAPTTPMKPYLPTF